MIHKISDFDSNVVVVQIKSPEFQGRTVDALEVNNVTCFAYTKEGKVPMVVIDARSDTDKDVLTSLEARGVCAVRKFENIEKNLVDALQLLQSQGHYGAAKIIEQEMETFSVRKVCKISC